MVWRGQFGERNGSFGGWISKPGYDVTTAAPGNFLLDTNSQVFQVILRGSTNLVANNRIKDQLVSKTYTVPLPTVASSFSRLYVSGSAAYFDTYYQVWVSRKFLIFQDENIQWSINNGVLTITHTYDYYTSMSCTLWWTVYRGQF